jgi:hypothetical protein
VIQPGSGPWFSQQSLVDSPRNPFCLQILVLTNQKSFGFQALVSFFGFKELNFDIQN